LRQAAQRLEARLTLKEPKIPAKPKPWTQMPALAIVVRRRRRWLCRGGRFLWFRDLVGLAMLPDDIQEGVGVFFKLSRADPVNHR
jgi:hypothetical protein